MNKKVLKSIKDLKVGMKVYIRDDWEFEKWYGGIRYSNDMVSGLITVDGIDLSFPESINKNRYHYTAEMIDWDKTNALNCPLKTNKDEKGETEMTKEEFFKKYKGEDIGVSCDTKEKSDEFLRLAEKFEVKWMSGNEPTSLDYFDKDYVKKAYYTITNDNRLLNGYEHGDTVVPFESAPTTQPSEPKQSNPVKLPEIKVVNSESDNDLGFKTFIQVGDNIVIYVEDDVVGVARCHPDNEFNLEVCKALAYYRWVKGE